MSKFVITTYSRGRGHVGRIGAEYDTLKAAKADTDRYFWQQQLAFIHNTKAGCIALVYDYEAQRFCKPTAEQQHQFAYYDGKVIFK